jgi:hypothetical protein
MLQRPLDRIGGQFRPAERAENTFAGERIEESGGVADEQIASSRDTANFPSERADPTNRRDPPRVAERFDDSGQFRQAPLEVALDRLARLLHTERPNQANVDDPSTNRRQPTIETSADMHLAETINRRYAVVARNQAETARPTDRHIEAERTRDGRMQPIGRHHETRPHVRFSIRAAHSDPHDAAIFQQRAPHAPLFLHAGTVGTSMIEQDAVEDRTRNAKPGSVVAASIRFVGDEKGRALGAHAHTERSSRLCRDQIIERSQSLDDLDDARAEIFGARLFPWESRAFEQEHIVTTPRQQAGRGSTGRAAANDQHLGIQPAHGAACAIIATR